MALFNSSNPIVKEGITYPHLAMNLAISPNITETNIGGSVAIRLTPYRVLENGTFEFLHDETKALSYGDVFENIAQGDSALAIAAGTIVQGVQGLINAKGL
jgi:hypothetical protein